MKCPKCSLINPPGAQRCDCGYDFESETLELSYLSSQEGAAQASGPMFLHIPVSRLVFMSIISSGLYEIYWIYKNWNFLKERDGLHIQPLWRGIFGLFYCYGILKSIRNDHHTNAVEKATFSAGGLALGWILLVGVGNALGMVDDIAMNFLGIVIAVPSFLFFVPVQNYINRVNAKLSPKAGYNRWSAGHIVCLVLGVLIWFLLLAGLALPE